MQPVGQLAPEIRARLARAVWSRVNLSQQGQQLSVGDLLQQGREPGSQVVAQLKPVVGRQFDGHHRLGDDELCLPLRNGDKCFDSVIEIRQPPKPAQEHPDDLGEPTAVWEQSLEQVLGKDLRRQHGRGQRLNDLRLQARLLVIADLKVG